MRFVFIELFVVPAACRPYAFSLRPTAPVTTAKNKIRKIMPGYHSYVPGTMYRMYKYCC